MSWASTCRPFISARVRSNEKLIGRYLVAALLAVVGAIFLGQGLGYIPGSGMTGQTFWAVVGAVMLVAAAGLALMTRRSSAR